MELPEKMEKIFADGAMQLCEVNIKDEDVYPGERHDGVGPDWRTCGRKCRHMRRGHNMHQKMIAKKLYRRCPVCSNAYGTVLHTIRMELPEDVSLPNEYDVVCCDKCGFAYADVNVSQDAYNSYYKTSNIYSQTDTLRAKIIKNREEMRCRVLSEYADYNARILDVGCGAGRLLRCLHEKGFYNICGIDPSANSINALKENEINGYVLNVFDDIPKELRGSFDVVRFTAVLEHIYDLDLCIKQLEGYLNDNGILYIVVPAVESFKDVYRKIPNYFNHEHINYFSVNSLDNLLGKHGFTRENSDSECMEFLKSEEAAIVAIYKKTCKGIKMVKDEVSKESIQKYFEQALIKEQNDYNGVLNFLGESPSRIVVWGAGAYAMQLIKNIPELEKRIEYFVDGNKMKAGTPLCGKMVYEPEKLNEPGQCYPVLICAMRNQKEIAEQIEKMGITNPVFIA